MSEIKFDWLTDWPTDQPTNQPTDQPTDQLTYQPTNWPTDQPTDQLTDQPTNQQTDRLTDWQTDWLTDWLTRDFCFKTFTSLHSVLAMALQDCLNKGDIPEWMVKGRTVLIQKYPAKGTVANNYRPIACLPLMWKLLSGIFADKIYDHLLMNSFLPYEQKGCRKGVRGTKDQLLKWWRSRGSQECGIID